MRRYLVRTVPENWRIEGLVDKIEALRRHFPMRTAGKTEEYKKRLTEGETLDDLLRGYANRKRLQNVLNMEHYRVQLIGVSSALSQRCAVKVRLWCLPFPYLNFEGKGVHVVTVNDYLVRDAEWIALSSWD